MLALKWAMCSTEKVGAVSSSGMAAAIRVYPESGCLYPELQSPPIFSRLLSHRELSHAAPFSANSAKLNRQTPEIEHLATRTKQTPVICSNRQKIHFWFDENQRLIGLRQGTASAVPNAAQPSGVSTPEARCRARTSIANALSNRELQLLEPRLIHRKQTIAPRSNRELSTNRCRGNSHAVIPVPTFLTETRSHSEFIVTHSKQTTAPFLTGSRIATKRLVSRIVFRRVSSEHFSTRRRISLQDGIAQPRLIAGQPRMHAPVGRP